MVAISVVEHQTLSLLVLKYYSTIDEKFRIFEEANENLKQTLKYKSTCSQHLKAFNPFSEASQESHLITHSPQSCRSFFEDRQKSFNIESLYILYLILQFCSFFQSCLNVRIIYCKLVNLLSACFALCFLRVL